nr:ribonuclease H-like domain-containing protein [Tanacetum cinerariifolium]
MNSYTFMSLDVKEGEEVNSRRKTFTKRAIAFIKSRRQANRLTRNNITRDRSGAHDRLIATFLVRTPCTMQLNSERRFEWLASSFNQIVTDVSNHDAFFRTNMDCTGREAISGLLKCTSTIRQLTYDIHVDFLDKYMQISENFTLDVSDPLHLHPNDSAALTIVSAKLKGTKNHQILMGLDDTYMQIRSSILPRETLSDVRSAYATIFSENSHRVASGSIIGTSQRSQTSAIVSNDSVTQKAYTTSNVFQDLNHINFFDNEYPEIPNDDERVDLSLNSAYKSHSDSSHSFVPGEGVNIDNFLSGNNGNDAQCTDDTFAAHNEQVTTLEDNIISEGNLDQNPSSSTQGAQNSRRSSTQSVFPRNYNDFVVDLKVKYDLEKFVNYSKLNAKTLCFVTRLNKNNEPKTFFETSKYALWTDAMNNTMDALLEMKLGKSLICLKIEKL